MQYLVQGLFDSYNNGIKVIAETPLAAIKDLLAKNQLKGKIEKAKGRGNCTVTSLGERKVTSNYTVTNLVPNVPKKKAFCIISYECKPNKETRIFKQYLYNGSAERFVAEAKANYKVTEPKRARYWGKPSYGLYVDNTFLTIIEIQGSMPKNVYLLYANCVLAKAVHHNTRFNGTERVFNETFEVFGSETKRKSMANALVKNYKATISKHVGKASFKKETAHMWLVKDALDCVNKTDTGFMSNLNKEGTGPLGLYNIVFETLKPQDFSHIIHDCIIEDDYWSSKDIYDHM